jgi:hypothetical protein
MYIAGAIGSRIPRFGASRTTPTTSNQPSRPGALSTHGGFWRSANDRSRTRLPIGSSFGHSCRAMVSLITVMPSARTSSDADHACPRTSGIFNVAK